MENAQWPLTAAATQMLLDLPPSNAKRGGQPNAKVAVKLGLKELIVRGAYRISIEQKRRRSEVTLYAQDAAGLPPSLSGFHSALRPHTPGEISEVLRRARKSNRNLIRDLGNLFRDELAGLGLVEERREKMLGIFGVERWRRTASGDAWAGTASQHRARLEGLPAEIDQDPQSAARAAAVAGALALLVPAALASIGRLRRRMRRYGGDLHFDPGYYVYAGGTGEPGAGFDPFDAVGDMLEGALEGLESGIEAVDSALDSVADSIDSAVDSGVDAGGGDGGGGDGGDGGGGD